MNRRGLLVAGGAAGLGLAALAAWSGRPGGDGTDARIAVSFERPDNGLAQAMRPGGPTADGLREALAVPDEAQAPGDAVPGRLEPRDERPLVVQVVDPSGHPVPGAGLEVFRGNWARPLVAETSDALGYRELSGASPGDRLHVEAEGHLGVRLTLPEGLWPVPWPVVLQRGTVLLSGVVLDESRDPVDGVELVLEVPGRRYGATSASDGRFAFEAAPESELPDEVVLYARTEEHCFLAEGLPIAWREHLVEGELRVVLLTWARLSVDVRDQEDRALAGGELVLALPEDHEERFLLPGGGTSVSLAGGLVERGAAREPRVLERAPPRIPLSLVVRHPDCAPYELSLGELEPGEERAVEAVLQRVLPPGPIVFRIVAPDGAPLATAGASVSVGEAGSSSWSKLAVDAGGHVRVEPPGADWVLSVWAEGHLPVERAHPAAFRSDEVIELVLEASPHRLEVRVEDAEGRGLADLSVAVVPVETRRSSGEWRLRTDSGGRALFRGLQPDTPVRVELGHGRPGHYFPGGDAADVPSPAFHRLWFDGDERIVFRLVAPASVEGRILAGGLGGSTAHLSCYGAAPHPDLPRFAVAAPLGDDGTFLFDGLPPGRYHLWTGAVAGGDAPTRALAVFDLAPEEALRGLEVRPPR